MNAYAETRQIMKQYGIIANKKLGQNFLIEDRVIDAMIESANVTKEDFIIEIGPGLGTLTKRLLEKAGKVIAIELDERMIHILEDRFSKESHFEILHQDVLQVDLASLIQREKIEKDIQAVKIVANLPYYITTPIIMKLLEDRLEIESITVMIQKEVADRLTALPGQKSAGAITYRVYDYAIAKQVIQVEKESFIPQPEVASEVITLQLRKQPIVALQDEKKLFECIKVAFMQRRKTFANALVNSGWNISKQEVEKILMQEGIDSNIRGESITFEQFVKIAKKL